MFLVSDRDGRDRTTDELVGVEAVSAEGYERVALPADAPGEAFRGQRSG